MLIKGLSFLQSRPGVRCWYTQSSGAARALQRARTKGRSRVAAQSQTLSGIRIKDLGLVLRVWIRIQMGSGGSRSGSGCYEHALWAAASAPMSGGPPTTNLSLRQIATGKKTYTLKTLIP